MTDSVKPRQLEQALLEDAAPLAVAFLKRNAHYAEQVRTLAQACQATSPPTACCVCDPDYLPSAARKYDVHGTPTFVLFSDGRERGRLIGAADADSLQDFIAEALHENEAC